METEKQKQSNLLNFIKEIKCQAEANGEVFDIDFLKGMIDGAGMFEGFIKNKDGQDLDNYIQGVRETVKLVEEAK